MSIPENSSSDCNAEGLVEDCNFYKKQIEIYWKKLEALRRNNECVENEIKSLKEEHNRNKAYLDSVLNCPCAGQEYEQNATSLSESFSQCGNEQYYNQHLQQSEGSHCETLTKIDEVEGKKCSVDFILRLREQLRMIEELEDKHTNMILMEREEAKEPISQKYLDSQIGTHGESEVLEPDRINLEDSEDKLKKDEDEGKEAEMDSVQLTETASKSEVPHKKSSYFNCTLQ